MQSSTCMLLFFSVACGDRPFGNPGLTITVDENEILSTDNEPPPTPREQKLNWPENDVNNVCVDIMSETQAKVIDKDPVPVEPACGVPNSEKAEYSVGPFSCENGQWAVKRQFEFKVALMGLSANVGVNFEQGIAATCAAGVSVECATQGEDLGQVHIRMMDALKTQYEHQQVPCQDDANTRFIEKAFVLAAMALDVHIHHDSAANDQIRAKKEELHVFTSNSKKEGGVMSLKTIAERLGIQDTALEDGLRGKAGPIKFKVALSAGAGVAAALKFGQVDKNGWISYGGSGSISAALTAGVDCFLSKHTSGKKIKIFLGISNFTFEYEIPLK